MWMMCKSIGTLPPRHIRMLKKKKKKDKKEINGRLSVILPLMCKLILEMNGSTLQILDTKVA